MKRVPSFWRDRRGGIAITFALAAPVLALLACGAVDLAAVASSKNLMQDAADAAALNAAHQLDLSDEAGIKSRAEQFVRGQIGEQTDFTYTVTTTVGAANADVEVRIDGNRPSFFANLLPPGGWDVTVSSVAKPMARRPLCVLNTSTSGADNIVMSQTAKLNAPDCMVSSNSGIQVTNSALLSAAAVQSTGASSGAISPDPMIGAPQIPDPFVSMAISPDSKTCQIGDLLSVLGLLQGTFYIPPGVHCGNISVGQNQKIVLMPGEHYFLNSDLRLLSNAEMTGEDVTLVFGSNSKFIFTQKSVIRLKGRKTGPYAGFVIATTRKNINTFEISSDNARELLGTIYVPSATLQVTGAGNSVADQSAWTVILAKSIKMSGSASLVVNAAYGGSPVPVPKGVGPLSNVAISR